MTSDATSEAINDGKRRRLANLKPFPKGASGNPSGLPGGDKRARAKAEETAKFTAYYGREPTVPEGHKLDALARALTAKPRGAAEELKQANAISRISEALYGKPEAPRRRYGFRDAVAVAPNAIRDHVARQTRGEG